MRPRKRWSIALGPIVLAAVLSGCMALDPPDRPAEAVPEEAGEASAEVAAEGPVKVRVDETAMPPPPDIVTGTGGPAKVTEPLAFYYTSPQALAALGRLEPGPPPEPKRPGPGPRPRVEVDSDGVGVSDGEALGASSPFGSGGLENEDPPAALAPPFSSTFDSITFTDNPANTGGFLFIPPDPIGAAGPAHVVSVVNVTIQFHTKAGAPLLGATGSSLASFFTSVGCPPLLGDFTFDPKVIYDQHAGRFLVVTLVRKDVLAGDPTDESFILVAVSDDADPTGVWNCTSIASKLTIGGLPRWADYPGFAVDEEAVYITANMFAFFSSGGTFGGTRLWVIDKFAGAGGGFYTPGGTATVSLFDPVPPGGFAGTTQPAHIFGTAPTTPNVGTWLILYDSLTTGGPGGQEAMQVVRLDDPIGPGTPTFFGPSFAFLGDIEEVGGIYSFPALPDAPQLGSSETIEVNNRRTLNAVWQNSRLYTTTTIDPKTGDPSSGEATAFWVEVDTSTLGSPAVANSGAIGGDDIAPGTYTFFPSVAINPGDDLAIGFSASASTIYPSSAYTTRKASDPAGFTSGSTLLRSGLDYYIRTFDSPPCSATPADNRWGDYSGAAVDPADGCFWIYNEHAVSRGTGSTGGCNGRPAIEDGRWGTAFGRACICSATEALTTGAWKQVSLPCDPGTADTVADVFGDDLGGTYDVNWVVYRRDEATTSYVKLTTGDSLSVGEGYWLKSNLAGQSVTVESYDNTLTDIPLTGVAAAPPAGCASSAGQCNKVGHPHNFDVCWADVLVDDGGVIKDLATVDPGTCQTTGTGCIMSRVAHKWTGSSYAPFDGVTPGMMGTLNPWDGFWVSANKPGIELRIPATPGTLCDPPPPPAAAPAAGTSAAPAAPGARADGTWYIRLIAESGELVDSSNVLGQAPTSRQGYDAFDLLELDPFGSDYLTIVFPHANWARPGDYSSDFRELENRRRRVTWHFEVRSSDPGARVELRWEGPRDRLWRSRLVDMETRTLIRPHRDGSYAFTMSGPSRAFRWTVRQRPLRGLRQSAAVR